MPSCCQWEIQNLQIISVLIPFKIWQSGLLMPLTFISVVKLLHKGIEVSLYIRCTCLLSDIKCPPHSDSSADWTWKGILSCSSLFLIAVWCNILHRQWCPKGRVHCILQWLAPLSLQWFEEQLKATTTKAHSNWNTWPLKHTATRMHL